MRFPAVLFVLMLILPLAGAGPWQHRGAVMRDHGITRVVICAEGRAQVIALDAAGNPVKSAPGHGCRDCAGCGCGCAPAPAVLAQGPVPRLSRAAARLRRGCLRHSLAPRTGPRLSRASRGPPCLR